MFIEGQLSFLFQTYEMVFFLFFFFATATTWEGKELKLMKKWADGARVL